MTGNLQSLLGLIVLPAIAYGLCENRSALAVGMAARVAGVGIVCQIFIAGVFLLVPGMADFFGVLAQGVDALQSATGQGARLVFGYLAGGPAPFDVTQPHNSFVLGLQALPLILVVSVLSRLLFHWGVLQRIVAVFAWGLRRSMGVGGPLGTSAAANIFVGMVEAPLLVRPYIRDMGRGALFATMSVGMATVAGTVMVLYASLLEPSLPGATGHILAASLMSAPAALMIARLMVPDGFDADRAATTISLDDAPQSNMDAIVKGTQEGVKLLVMVAAMLLVMVALVALANQVLSLAGAPLGIDITVERILGWIAKPLAFLIGIPWNEAATAGELIGIKTVLNEFLAYLKLASLPVETLSERSRLIMTYALCGFANFGSLGIMTGGLIAMCPERRADIVVLGPRTLVSGTLATLMTGAAAGLLT